MTNPVQVTTTDAVKPKTFRASRQSGLRRAFGNALRMPRGRVGLALTLFVVAVAVIGPFFAHNTTGFVGDPFGHAQAGPLGADVLGRNVFDRVLDGGWKLLAAGAIATALAVATGAFVGVLAAYKEGWIDQLLMRSTDVVLVIPQLVLALVLVSFHSTSMSLVVLAVAISQAPQVARVSHACAQGVCERDFVKAVALWGVPTWKVISRQVLPNLVTPLTVEAGLRLSASIIMISGLNFLGFGVNPPAPSWGVMINENRIGLGINPWGVLAPVILLGLLAVGTNLLADSLARANLGGQPEQLELSTSVN